MRLTNINCPQCNGMLNQQDDKFYCTSCGSAFNIDYDEKDVEYAKLVTEPERTRLLLEKDRILLEKNEELRRKFLTSEMKNEFVHQVKSQGTTYVGSIILGAVMSGLSLLMCFGVIAVIFVNALNDSRKERNQRNAVEQARIERAEALSAEDIENDQNFLENAVAAGVCYENSRRDKPVVNNGEENGDAYTEGYPVAVNCYLVKNGSNNDLYIVYKNTYEYSVSGATRDVYDCVCFKDIEPDGTGHISFGKYQCNQASGDGIDWHWIGYEEADDIYENVLPKDSVILEVDL